MLLIDGVKYYEWTPANEDEFERVMQEHTQEIFGEQSIYLDRKQKLKSLSGIGSIPDGYVIVFGDSPHWHIVEVELSSHPLHEHIVSQVSKFISGMSNPNIQRGIVNAIHDETIKDDFLKLKVKKTIEPIEIYKFLSDLISRQPILTIIIEKDTEELREALNTLRYPQINVVEFQTFTRGGVGLSVHVHLFEPLYKDGKGGEEEGNGQKGKGEEKEDGKRRRRVTVGDLIGSNFLKVGQVIYGRYGDNRYEATILQGGRIKLVHNGNEYDSPSGAGRGVLDYAVDGWTWWLTTRENGSECVLDELRKEYTAIHLNNP